MVISVYLTAECGFKVNAYTFTIGPEVREGAYVQGYWRICVVGQALIELISNKNTIKWEPGVSWIAGWLGWNARTPDRIVNYLRNNFHQKIIAAAANPDLSGVVLMRVLSCSENMTRQAGKCQT